MEQQLKLIRLKEVMQLTGLSRSSVYKHMQAGSFPKQVSLGERSVAWVESEVLCWVNQRISERAV